jgi:hypothetical protein
LSDTHRRVFTLYLMEQDRLALDAGQRSEMQAHLAACPSCQAYLKLYLGLKAQASQRRRETAPLVDMEKVLGRVQARARLRWMTWSVQVVIWIGLGLLALVLVQWIFTNLRPTPAGVPPSGITTSVQTLAISTPESTPAAGAVETWPTPDLEDMILPEDLKAYDNFGTALASDENLLAVGAPNTDLDTSRNVGIVYLFERRGDGWQQVARLTPELPQADGRFGSTLAMDGDVLAVGAPYEYNPGAGNASGAVYVFTRSKDQWVQAVRLSAEDGWSFDLFGSALALKGGDLAVGARGADGSSGRDTGAVYLYHREGGEWNLQTRLGEQAAAFDHFGQALAFAGNDLLIGAPDADPNQVPNAGQVYVYRRTGRNWSEQGWLTADDIRPQSRFGAALSGQGDQLAVVAPQEYQKPGPMPPFGFAWEIDFGMVHIFERKGNQWQWQARLFPEPADEQDAVRVGSALITTISGKVYLAISGYGRAALFSFEQRDGSWQALPAVYLPEFALVEGPSLAAANGQILLGGRFYDIPGPYSDALQSAGVVWIIDR